MSYILDALKKAESERNLGAVPNVYAQTPNGPDNKDEQHWGKMLPWSLTAITVGILLLALAWLQPWRQQVPALAVTPAPIVTPAVITAPPVAATPPTLTPAPPPAMDTSPATPTVVMQAKPEPAAPVSKPVPQAVVNPPARQRPAPAAVSEVVPPSVPAPAMTPKAAPAQEEKEVGTARDLPQYVQAQLPTLSVNGYIYAKDPTDRSVLINQKLLHEGDTVTSELVLEKLLPKGAILNYKGYRYRISF